MRRVVTLLLAAATLAACNAQAAGAPPATPQSVDAAAVVAPVEVVTPAPVATPRWTPAATPDPTPVMTGDHAAYTAFLDRAAASSDSTAFAAWSKAIDQQDWDRFVDASRKLRAASLIFVDWLDLHPPRACYKQMWTLTRAGAVAFAKAQTSYVKWARSGKHADYVRADDLLHTWGENVTRGSALIASNDCPE